MVRGRVGRSATTEGASQANGPGEQIPIRLEGSLSKEEAAVLHEREEPGHLTVEVGKVLENIAHVEDVCKPTLVECLVHGHHRKSCSRGGIVRNVFPELDTEHVPSALLRRNQELAAPATVVDEGARRKSVQPREDPCGFGRIRDRFKPRARSIARPIHGLEIRRIGHGTAVERSATSAGYVRELLALIASRAEPRRLGRFLGAQGTRCRLPEIAFRELVLDRARNQHCCLSGTTKRLQRNSNENVLPEL